MILSRDGDLVLSRRKKLIDVYYRKILQLLETSWRGQFSKDREEMLEQHFGGKTHNGEPKPKKAKTLLAPSSFPLFR